MGLLLCGAYIYMLAAHPVATTVVTGWIAYSWLWPDNTVHHRHHHYHHRR